MYIDKRCYRGVCRYFYFIGKKIVQKLLTSLDKKFILSFRKDTKNVQLLN